MVKRNDAIDTLKALAIISVIFVHGLSDVRLYKIFAPYYIWQAVPVFMVLMGDNAAQSFMRKNQTKLSRIFTPHYLMNKVRRIFLPFTCIWLLEVIIQYVHFENKDIKKLLTSYFEGGYGPGSYFIPIMIQATVIIPFLYIIMRKKPTRMMILLFFVSLFIDVMSYTLTIDGSLYRILIIRYLFALVLGIWYALKKSDIKVKGLIIPALVSFIYITAVYYYDWIGIVEKFWNSQHAPSYFYTFLIILVANNYLSIGRESPLEKLSLLIGRASFHIYLTQMFYFWCIHAYFSDLSGILYVFTFLTIPIVTGLLFYKLDIKWTKPNQTRKDKKSR